MKKAWVTLATAYGFEVEYNDVSELDDVISTLEVPLNEITQEDFVVGDVIDEDGYEIEYLG